MLSAQQVVADALAVAVAARVPTLLWGAPGTGKTAVVRSLAAAAGWPCETVIASIREPSDFAGLPVVTDAGVRLAPPAWALRLASGTDGLLFLDEVSTAPPAVQAALLRVVLERTVGDLALPEQVAVVAAANPPEQAADGWDLSPPLANRFCHLDWPADARRLAEGFTAGWGAPTPPRVPAGAEASVGVARSWVAGFVSVRPQLAVAVPEGAAAGGRAWPSPRSWETAARLLGTARAAGQDEPVAAALVRGAVGDGAGVEFLTWLAEADLPDPEAVLADPRSFVLPARGDRAFAALGSVAAAVAADPTPQRWAAGWAVFGAAAERAPDVAATAARTLARCRPPGAPVPPEVAAFTALLRDAQLLS